MLFTELNDPLDQRERFVQQVKDKQLEGNEGKVDEDFLLPWTRYAADRRIGRGN